MSNSSHVPCTSWRRHRQLGLIPPKESNPTIFDSYIREAKVFDNAMVARWKVAMDGLILFAALFSAVVTAFIIESYRSLSRDSSEVIILLLFQMSQQLSALGNSSVAAPVIQSALDLPLFTAPRSAVYTNVFWFLSLGLSLACALIATLIQQWASDYIHAIERRQAPEKRARIRSFLFEGVESSNLGTIVEGVPLLLHTSLFSFLVGLVIFTHPINSIITALLAFILSSCAIAYLSSTVLPLIFIASPIRTPLTMFLLKSSLVRNMCRRGLETVREVGRMLASGFSSVAVSAWRLISTGTLAIWERICISRPVQVVTSKLRPSWILGLELRWVIERFFPRLHTIWINPGLEDSNLDSIRESFATNSEQPGFEDRERKALFWTFDSLSNDAELVPFLEAIPSFLDSEASNNYDPVEIMRSFIIRNSNTLGQRLQSLLRPTSDNRSPEASIRAVTSLLEHGIYPAPHVGFAQIFLPTARPVCQDLDYHWLELVLTTAWAQNWPWLSFPGKGRWTTFEFLAILEHVGSDSPEHLRELHAELMSQIPNDETSVDRLREVFAYASLMALSKLWCTKLEKLGDRLNMLSKLFKSLAFLANGTHFAQRAYASAMYQIALSASKAPQEIFTDILLRKDYNDKSFWEDVFPEVLRSLSRVTDPDAMEHVLAVFELHIWWRYMVSETLEILGSSSSLLLNHPRLFPIYRTHHLIEHWYGYIRYNKFIPDPPMELTLATMSSENQISLALGLQRRLRFGSLPSYLSVNINIPVQLCRIIPTLSDPHAVIMIRKWLETVTGPNRLRLYNSPDDETFVQAASAALEILKEKALQPEFGFKALLAIREDESHIPFDWTHERTRSLQSQLQTTVRVVADLLNRGAIQAALKGQAPRDNTIE
ncbi:hypothetical protein C8J56DRAFT_352068 [Mycena floridula]|nr:hypothetical protein C8J56DRAFT_352068 [Mycena floridula]